MASRRSASDLGGTPRARHRLIGAWRTNAGPCGPASDCLPPTGCPTKRPSPARWCSYTYCRSLHITSFRSRATLPEHGGECKSAGVQDLERPIEDRVRVRGHVGGQLDHDVRLDAHVM